MRVRTELRHRVELLARGGPVDRRRHPPLDDANVLVMSLKRTEPETAKEILDAWFAVEQPDPDELQNISRLAELERR
jgi:ribose 5-phosphate isomerase RpiB